MHKLLSRPHYKGEGLYGVTTKKQTENGIVRTVNEPEKVVAVPYPVIVGEELWGAVQDRKLRNRLLQRRGEKRFYLLAGLAKCGECGQTLSGQAKKSGRTGREYLYYRCMTAKRSGFPCRPSSYIRADVLDAKVWETVVDMLADPWQFVENVDGVADGQSDRDADLAAARREHAKVSGENSRLVRAYVQEIITEEELVQQRKFITERLEWTASRVTDLEAAARVRLERAQTADSVIAWAGRIGGRSGRAGRQRAPRRAPVDLFRRLCRRRRDHYRVSHPSRLYGYRLSVNLSTACSHVRPPSVDRHVQLPSHCWRSSSDTLSR